MSERIPESDTQKIIGSFLMKIYGRKLNICLKKVYYDIRSNYYFVCIVIHLKIKLNLYNQYLTNHCSHTTSSSNKVLGLRQVNLEC